MSPTEPQPTPKRGLIRRTLRDRWKPILAIWLVGSVLLAVGVYSLFTPVYRASALLRVDSLAPDLYGVRAGGQGMETFLTTQVQLITSPNVLTTAATDSKALKWPRITAATDVVHELKKVIQVGVVPGTSLIEIGMTSETPSEAADLVNSVVRAFIESQTTWAEGMSRTQRQTLDDYLSDLDKKTKQLEKDWKILASRAAPGAQVFVKGQDRRADVTLGQYERLRDDLFHTGTELAIAEAWASEMKAAVSNAEKNPASPADEALLKPVIERRFRHDPEVIDLTSQMMEAKAKLDEIRKAVRPADDPAQQEAVKKIKALEARYDQLWETRHRQIREEILANKRNLDGELFDAESKVRALSVRQKVLKEQFDRLEVRNPRQASDEVDIALIHEQRASLNSMKEAVVKRLEQLNFEARGEARTRIFNPATAPGAPVSDPRFQLMALIPVLMLPLTFAFFLVIEALSGASTGRAKATAPAEV